jgi:hypothetical protein
MPQGLSSAFQTPNFPLNLKNTIRHNQQWKKHRCRKMPKMPCHHFDVVVVEVAGAGVVVDDAEAGVVVDELAGTSPSIALTAARIADVALPTVVTASVICVTLGIALTVLVRLAIAVSRAANSVLSPVKLIGGNERPI